MTRAYPYTAWVLMPSFKPKQVELVKKYPSWHEDDYELTNSGKIYGAAEIFASQADAIAAGRQSLERQRIGLDKKLANLTKKHAALDKAEKEAP